MNYYSTNNKDHKVSLKEAVIKGLASDKGLYWPEKINQLPAKFIKELSQLSFPEIANTVAQHLLGEDLEKDIIEKIVFDAFNFDVPLVKVEEDIYSLELYHGPTLAFKDVGARFMARLLGHFVKNEDREITVLVATSGDTGGAVASGFLGIKGVRVVILYPSGKVSELQEKQLTTMGQNITALEVNGTFDDCQRIVKDLFLDAEMHKKLNLTSANSINIARLIPQSFYYFNAIAQLGSYDKVVVSIPSGNFGNLTGGLLAKRMGLPIDVFIAATNINDVVPAYLETTVYEPRPSVQTISNAMDVGDPSNFSRMMELYNSEHSAIVKTVKGYRLSDHDTKEVLKKVYLEKGYLLDPHGAVAYDALVKFMTKNEGYKGIFLETAHPAKFLEVVEPVVAKKIKLPEQLVSLKDKKKISVKVGNNTTEVKSFLMNF